MRSLVKVSMLVVVLLAANAMATPVEVILQQGLNGYAGTEDTQLVSGSGRNFGATLVCYITPSATRRALLRFDLSSLPENAQATGEAELTIWTSCSGGGLTSEMTVSMHVMTPASNNWVEGEGTGSNWVAGCTWANGGDGSTPWAGGAGLASGVDYEATPISTSTGQFGSGWAKTFTFSQAEMQDAIDLGHLTVVFLGDGNEGGKSMYFRTSEDTTSQPKLEFSYDIVPEPATVGLLSLGSLFFIRSRRQSAAHR